jgi:heat-inducible transcriptional repressor
MPHYNHGMKLQPPIAPDLSLRNRHVLRMIVEGYIHSGEAVGSKTLSQELARLVGLELSPATVRNVMADLEESGLLYAPHISAGRLPTEAGLQLFVDQMLEVNALDPTHQAELEQHVEEAQPFMPQAMENLSLALSSLSQCAGLVTAPKQDRPFKQVEFVYLAAGKTLVVWVGIDGHVENRLLDVDPNLTPSDLKKASNFLTHHLHGRTLNEAKKSIATDIATQRAALDNATQLLVEQGLAIPMDTERTLIVRGTSHLLNDVRAMAELERIKRLFSVLEQRETAFNLMEATEKASGVQIFIGAQNPLFNDAGCAMIIAPYHNTSKQLIGAIGVIGPTRMNYGRIIPMIDYTAKILSRGLK